jgi:hypothetical protein
MTQIHMNATVTPPTTPPFGPAVERKPIDPIMIRQETIPHPPMSSNGRRPNLSTRYDDVKMTTRDRRLMITVPKKGFESPAARKKMAELPLD